MIIIATIILTIVGLLIYISNSKLKKQTENFTSLIGLNPLTTYDDYGTFNFILHTNDLPYYDKGFAGMFCPTAYRAKALTRFSGKSDYVPKIRKPNINANIDFDADSFIGYEGFKVRRDLVPSNYTIGNDYGNADLSQRDFSILIDRPMASINPPEPRNYYFK